MRSILFVLVIAGCGGSNSDTTPDYSEPSLLGDLTADEGSEADVQIYHLYSFASGGTGILYGSSSPDATCETVADYIDFATNEYDPTALFPAGTCNMFLLFYYDPGVGYDGDVVEADDWMGGQWSISCTMNSGEWVYETRNGFTDYFYSGKFWQGAPLSGTTTYTGSDGDLTVEVALNGFEGNFIYEHMSSVPANGSIDGQIKTEWCTSLATTGYL